MPNAPTPLRAVALLVLLQALGLAGVAVFYVVELFVADAADRAGAVAAGIIALICGVGLLLVARGLAGARRWARSPALVIQLLAVPVAVGLLQGGRWYVGLPLLLWAIAVTVLLFTPAVSHALEE